MKDVGLKLAQKRRELNLSYEDVCKMTKLPMATIKAIEEGDLDHFQDELTYVRFYVRSYCKALDVPYEDFRDDVLGSIDDYTTTLSLQKEEAHGETEKAIIKRTSRHAKDDTGEQPTFTSKKIVNSTIVPSDAPKRKSRIDFVLVSLIAVVAIAIAIVGYVLIDSFILNPSEDEVVEVEEDTTDTEASTPEKEETSEEEDTTQEEISEETEEVVESDITFTKQSDSYYIVEGLEAGEDITITITFTNSGNFNLWKGNTSYSGAYGTYEAGSTYTYENTVTIGEIITLNMWNYGGAEITVNGVELEYDESAQDSSSGYVLFVIKTGQS